MVDARVQGSRREPYRVRLAVARIPDAAWGRALRRLSARAEFVAALLAGHLPDTAEEIFRSARAPLLPSGDREFESDCSCPDWANPCKHIAAVHYLLAESMDRDPFVLLTLRGRTRPRILAALRASRKPVRRQGTPEHPAGAVERGRAATVGLPVVPFWGDAKRLRSTPLPPLQPSPVPDAILRRLGDPAFLRGTPELLDFLRSAYEQVGERARAVALPGTSDSGVPRPRKPSAASPKAARPKGTAAPRADRRVPRSV
ncbi:MAG: SWIM zinc finger family protein, partial [Thermoplasmata archaeon]